MSTATELDGEARLSSGEAVRFHLVGVKAIRHAVESLRSGRAFLGDSFVLAAQHRLVILQPGSVALVHLFDKPTVDAWTVDLAPVSIVAAQIEEDSWRRAREYLEVSGRRRGHGATAPGERITILGELRLGDGRRLHIRYELPTPRLAEQQDFLRSYFKTPMWEYDSLEGGLLFVNPRQVVAATFYSIAEPDADTWLVQDFTLPP